MTEAYGIRQYGPQISVSATCDSGHTYSYTLYPTENSKESPCLNVNCDEHAWPSR